jgi:hypothetical protein
VFLVAAWLKDPRDSNDGFLKLKISKGASQFHRNDRQERKGHRKGRRIVDPSHHRMFELGTRNWKSVFRGCGDRRASSTRQLSL